jgi:hypothetical protein
MALVAIQGTKRQVHHTKPGQPSLDARHQARPNKLHSNKGNAGGTEEALSSLVIYWYSNALAPLRRLSNKGLIGKAPLYMRGRAPYRSAVGAKARAAPSSS